MSHAPTIVAETLSEILSILTERVTTDNRLLWYRGQSCATWGVQPSVQRNYSSTDERSLTNRFRARARIRQHASPDYSNFGAWLSLMQHYGLPTRLLDWSRSAFVALYFAVEKWRDHPASDACIWILEPHRLNKAELEEKITPSIDAEMCREHLKPAFTHRSKETNKLIAVMAAESDFRMFVQQGCFTIHSYRGHIDERPDASDYLSSITIPSQCVENIATQLNVCGFRRGDLFPDLQNLADELKVQFGNLPHD